MLGVAVASAGDRAQGVQILRNVLRRHPYDRESLSGLASFEAALGHRDAALTYAKRPAGWSRRTRTFRRCWRNCNSDRECAEGARPRGPPALPLTFERDYFFCGIAALRALTGE